MDHKTKVKQTSEPAAPESRPPTSRAEGVDAVPIQREPAHGASGSLASVEAIKRALGHYAEQYPPTSNAPGEDGKKKDGPEASVSCQPGYNSKENKADVDLEGDFSIPLPGRKFGLGGYGKYNPTDGSFGFGPSAKYNVGGDFNRNLELHTGFSRSDGLNGFNVGGKYDQQLRPGEQGKDYTFQAGLDYTRYPGRQDFDASAQLSLGKNQFGLNGTYSTDPSQNKVGLEYMRKLNDRFSLGAGISANPSDLSHPTFGPKLQASF